MTNTYPVIMYPEGKSVGSVKSGKDKRSGKVRHVATGSDRTRIGTFDSLNAARDALIAAARESA